MQLSPLVQAGRLVQLVRQLIPQLQDARVRFLDERAVRIAFGEQQKLIQRPAGVGLIQFVLR